MFEENKIFRKFRKRDIMVARFIAILILGGMVTYGISSISEEEKVNQDKQNSLDKFAYDRAHDIASSVADILLTRLAENESYGVNTPPKEELSDEKVTYIVEDNFNQDDNLIEIKVTAKSKDVTTVITTDINRETKRKERINVKYLYE
jgi:hypothetical protein